MPKQLRSTSLQKTAQVIQLNTFTNKALEATMQQAKLCLPQGYQSISMKQTPEQSCFYNPNLRSHQVQLSYPTMGQRTARADRAMLASCCLNILTCAGFPRKRCCKHVPFSALLQSSQSNESVPSPRQVTSLQPSKLNTVSLDLCPQTIKIGLSWTKG